MTITQLEYVLAVAEHKNFTRAAEACHVTQPTLSMQIQKLELELDILIFDRAQKPLRLTDIGVKIVEQAKSIINEAKRMQDIVDLGKGYIGGEFNLGIIPTIMPTLLPMFLQNFIKKYPQVSLRIHELNTRKIIQQIKDGSLDAGIAATPLDEDSIKEETLYFEPFVAYIPASFPLHHKGKIRPEDLDISHILLLEDGHCFSDGVLNLCSASRKMNTSSFQLQSGSFETLIKLADEGMGITLLPYLHTLTLPNKENLRYFEEPSPAREVSLIYNENKLKQQTIEALHKVIMGIVRASIAFSDVKIISPILKNNPKTSSHKT